jgi:pyrroloquinoline quinone biosynthesis protein B
VRILVLGSAAGGGVPQWNCRCPVCSLAWNGDAQVKRRSQSSIAVSNDGDAFVLVNASPDLRQQILAAPSLQPRTEPRSSPLMACVVTSADVDHIAGLLTLREGQPFELYATGATLSALAANPIFKALADDCVKRKPIELERPFEPAPGLVFTAFGAPGKVALWQEGESVAIGGEGEGTIGLDMRGGGKRALYSPACAKVTPAFKARIAGADALMFDGTTFADNELIELGLSGKSAHRMGHVAMSGPDGSIAAFGDLKVGRKIFIHLNNSNPVLIEGSPERRRVEEAGWEVAYDGMEIAL